MCTLLSDLNANLYASFCDLTTNDKQFFEAKENYKEIA